jgi:hypothetical protein
MTYSRAPKDEVGVSLRVIFGCGVFLQGTTSRRYSLRNSYANRHGGIYDLPNELILHIVSYIINHSTLHNLSLVSITFNGISTASLYHTYKNRESEERSSRWPVSPEFPMAHSYESQARQLGKKSRSGIMADSVRC